MLSRYPLATQQLLSPETGSEPKIVPVQVILHTHGGINLTSEAVGHYFDRDDVHVEAHLSFKRDGRVVQYQLLDRQADANAAANGWWSGGQFLGAISAESEDTPGENAYTREQIHAIGMFLAWMKRYASLPLTRCAHFHAVGVGWHSLFSEWNPNHHNCPGKTKVLQVPEIIDVARWFEALSMREHGLTDVVDSIDFIDGTGGWRLQRDGGVITYGRAPFFGSFPGLPEKDRQGIHRFGHIEQYEGGYKLTDLCPEKHTYHFPAR